MGKDFHQILFAGAPPDPDGVPSIQLIKEIHLQPDGATEVWCVYPVTIVQARFNGFVEGAPWLCLPNRPEALEDAFWTGWRADKWACAEWWGRAHAEDWPIGYGSSPGTAYDDLVSRLCRLAGAEV